MYSLYEGLPDSDPPTQFPSSPTVRRHNPRPLVSPRRDVSGEGATTGGGTGSGQGARGLAARLRPRPGPHTDGRSPADTGVQVHTGGRPGERTNVVPPSSLVQVVDHFRGGRDSPSPDPNVGPGSGIGRTPLPPGRRTNPPHTPPPLPHLPDTDPALEGGDGSLDDFPVGKKIHGL